MNILQDGNWRDWWKVIYQAVKENEQEPKKKPLHGNFWGYRRHFGSHPNKPFPERILPLGQNPRRIEVESAIGYAKANLDAWLRRRVCYVLGLKPDQH
jgi:hypothetical protein